MTSLKDLGLRIQLGHQISHHCVNPSTAFNNDFVVISTNGLHRVAVDFCNCELAQPRYIQLLRMRLFPSTTIDPKTAATFEVLSLFQLLSFMSKVSAYEFYQTLVRYTNNTVSTAPVGIFV